MREYDHGHQQAAVFRSYSIALNGIRSPQGQSAPIKTDKQNVITDHPPLSLVFTYLDGGRDNSHHDQELHQNLAGCCSDKNWAVVGVNKDRLNTTGGGSAYGVSSKNHKMVQIFGTTEVRLTKNSQAFSVGDEVYARFPTQKEVYDMIDRREPVSLVVCRKTLAAPGSKSIVDLLGGPKTGNGCSEEVESEEDCFEILKKALEYSIFQQSGDQKHECSVAKVWEKATNVGYVGKAANTAEASQRALKLIARLEKETSYPLHRKIGRALKATREGASKLLIFLDP